MEIHDMFKPLNEKLELLHNKVKQSSPHTEFEEEVEDLKQKSEEIVENWLTFENKLGQLIQAMKHHPQDKEPLGEEVGEGMWENQEEQIADLYQKWYKSEDSATFTSNPDWKKGSALYELLMFEHAIPYLVKTVEQYPEFDTARLFLAHAYLAGDERSKARYQLSFLSETSTVPEIVQLALHGLGCMAGALKEYERSALYFEKIDMSSVQTEWLPVFIANYAKSLFHLQRYESCLEQWRWYYELMPSDWRGPYMLGKVFMKQGDQEAALSFWFEALQIQEDPVLLQDMAQHFEQGSLHGMAAQCYERMTRHHTMNRDAQAWFGLAWNLGLAQKKQKARQMFLKGLSLFPKHLELQVAYVWMLIYWNERNKVLKNLMTLKKQYPDHPLVIGLGYLYEGKLGAVDDVFASHLHVSQFPVS
ncbi:hypothetical protein [Bacillus horti]|uniref:Tetratricopeptide (TPR) repeat protein n=1 Tax=Caldalkalibacillus horti TaxID=77523 RepID=A0ABT9VX00_9BACI|nr:hypothetical protein [Bacillus horti]MDQ0165506.1 tetratricopeptide (TPR) repeat protein [Bacillus horti]